MEDINIQPPVRSELENQQKMLLNSKEIVKRARKFYRDNFKKLWPLYILGGLGGISFSGGSSNSGSSTNSTPSPYLNFLSNIPWWVWVLLGILLIAVSIFLFISRIALLKGISDVSNGKFVGVRDSYKKGLALFWSFILIGIMVSWSITGAVFLLIIPGIILSFYLFFSIYELIDKQKKGFQALLGSWALVRGHGWTLFGKLVMISLRIFLVGLLYFLAILIPTLLLIIPGVIFDITALWIVGIVLGGLASLCLIFVYLTPLSMIAMFELYYSFCNVRGVGNVVDEALNKKRKRKLIISMVVGVVGMVLIILSVLALIVLVNVTEYIDKAKNSNQVHKLEFYEQRTLEEAQQILDKVEEVQKAQSAGQDPKTINNWQMALENPYFKVTELTGKYLAKATVIFDPTTYKPQINLQFNDAGTKIFADVTSRNIGKPLVIILDGLSIIDTNGDGKIDSQDLYAPIIQEEITGGKAVITGDMSYDTANLIVSKLNSGVE